MAQATGIGPALRKARLERGKSIEEASRETRIRAEYLHALERERFDALPGEVYVRGFVRSYSNYLGLDPEKVVMLLNGHATPGADPVAFRDVPVSERPVPAAMPQPVITGRRRRLSWPVMVAAAAVVLVILGAIGLFSTTRSAPQVAQIPSNPAGAGAAGARVLVAVTANAPVHLTVTSDGKVVFDHDLKVGEGHEFVATTTIRIDLSAGGSALISANGQSLGAPGNAKEPYTNTFFPVDQQVLPSPGPSNGSTPSPAPSAS